MTTNTTTQTLTTADIDAIEVEVAALEEQHAGTYIPADEDLLDPAIARCLRYLGVHIPDEHIYQEV